MVNSKPLLALFLLGIMATSINAYTTSMRVPAVLENENAGTLTLVQLNVVNGNGNVSVSGPSSVDATTLGSAETAAHYTASFLKINESRYNFTYKIEDTNISVSGPSAGLAFTLLAVSGLEQRQLISNFTVTGTISGSGVVGPIGGVYDKTGAAKSGGMHFILVPRVSNSSFEDLLYYISQQQSGIPVIEVANLSQALPYAFGYANPRSLTLNLSTNYHVGSLSPANVVCNCNTSPFYSLVNYTMNFTSQTVKNLSSGFSSVAQQLSNNLNTYAKIQKEGYLYTAADFAFLDFINAYTLENTQSFNATMASNLLKNVSDYCSSLIPPTMTATNYEYVVGGRLRLYWANITIDETQTVLSAEQSTDDIVQSISSLGKALAWCKASDESFNIASLLQGNPVEVSPKIKPSIAALISKARNFGNNIYIQSALSAYNSGDYATAAYAAYYANVFGPQSLVSNTTTTQQLTSATLDNIANATNGVWPWQFSAQAEFYMQQSQFSSGASAKGYLEQAYSVSLLAKELALANSQINSSFIASSGIPSGGSATSQQIAGIEQDISQIYFILLINAVLMFVVLLVLLAHILSQRQATQPVPPTQPAPPVQVQQQTQPRSRKRPRPRG